MQDEVAEKTRLCCEVEAKLELLEITGEERMKEEKDKIVSILEAGFTERQRLALSELEQNLKQQHDQAMQNLADKVTNYSFYMILVASPLQNCSGNW